MRGGALARFGAALILPLLCAACVTRQVDVVVHSDHENQIELRGYVRRGDPVDRGYDHPVAISAQRISHILSAIEVRIGERDEHTLYPILTGKALVPISAAVSRALSQADSSQMVTVKTLRKHRRLGVFSRKHLSSFIVYVKDDYFNVSVSRVNWEVPRDPKTKLPEPRLGDEQMDFRVVPGKGMHAAGKQTIAARWRDPAFARASRELDHKDSGARTRTILLEETIPAEELGQELPEGMIDRLSPEALRELADLEELRRTGDITEAEYAIRREEIMGTGGR